MADTSFQELKERIRDDVQRLDLDDQIENAIFGAIDFYRASVFFQSDKIDASTSTVAYQQQYLAPSDCVSIRKLFITQGSTRYEVRNIPLGDLLALDAQQSSPVAGPPVKYANELKATGWTLFFFPRPDAAYTITLDYIAAIPPPADDNDSNWWTTDAREMVRAMAKFLLKTNVIKGDPTAAADKQLADWWFERLKQALGMRKFVGRVASHW